jgi:hypothetical protein
VTIIHVRGGEECIVWLGGDKVAQACPLKMVLLVKCALVLAKFV